MRWLACQDYVQDHYGIVKGSKRDVLWWQCLLRIIIAIIVIMTAVGSSSSVARPREDWPIGPQGAQVPSYLLYHRQEDDVMVNTTGNSSNNNNNGSGGNEGVAARSGGWRTTVKGV